MALFDAGMTRREFIKRTSLAGGALLLPIGCEDDPATPLAAPSKTSVALLDTSDRATAVGRVIGALGINPVKGKDVLIKPNFNTADAAPGSTHNDTLVALVDELWAMGAGKISLGERSNQITRDVMEAKGILPLLAVRDVQVIDFDGLPEKDWVHFQPRESHWSGGFRVARPMVEAECVVSTCCLKTHAYGGVFTMSLKLHVGVVPMLRHGWDYMGELHDSPHQRRMIAEINIPFAPDLIVMDGVEVFVDGGPAHGTRASGNVFLASTDRVAIDAAGVAILKLLGSNAAIMDHRIFEQEQIARAVDLGLGVESADEIALVAADDQSKGYRDRVSEVLHAA